MHKRLTAKCVSSPLFASIPTLFTGNTLPSDTACDELAEQQDANKHSSPTSAVITSALFISHPAHTPHIVPRRNASVPLRHSDGERDLALSIVQLQLMDVVEVSQV